MEGWLVWVMEVGCNRSAWCKRSVCVCVSSGINNVRIGTGLG
jgi:hypothetical protein